MKHRKAPETFGATALAAVEGAPQSQLQDANPHCSQIDWSRYPLTMNRQQLREVTHDGRSASYDREKEDPDFPKGFRLSDSPRARQLWWTRDVAIYLEKRAKAYQEKALQRTATLVQTKATRNSSGDRK